MDLLQYRYSAHLQHVDRQEFWMEFDALFPPLLSHGGKSSPLCWTFREFEPYLLVTSLSLTLPQLQIAEHYLFDGHDQETWSYYGPLNILAYNVSFHPFSFPLELVLTHLLVGWIPQRTPRFPICTLDSITRTSKTRFRFLRSFTSTL